MKGYRLFLLLSRAGQIGIIVFFLHISTLLFLCAHHLISSKPKPRKSIAIRTYSPEPLERKKERGAPAAVKKEPIPRKTSPPPQPPIKEKKNPSSQPKKEAPRIKSAPPPLQKQSVLNEISDQLETIAASPVKKEKSAPLFLPPKIESKPLPQTSDPDLSFSYGEYLIGYLQEALELPEYGEVTVKIEIDRFGKLAECKILDSKSTRNAQFLKNQLPELPLPCLNDFGILEASQTFIITFRNVETH